MNNTTSIFSLCAAMMGGATAQAAERPNILWLTFEDTSPQFIGCYGSSGAKTPTMDSLANNGIRFQYAFSNSTVSSASRSCIITGRDVNMMGTGNHRYERTVPSDIKGFPYYLRQAGYYTSNNVKTDYNIANPTFISDAWNESSSSAHWRRRTNTDAPFFSVFNIVYSHQSYTTRNDYTSYKTAVYDNLATNQVTDPSVATVPDFYLNNSEMQFQLARVQNCINYTDAQMANIVAQLKADGLDSTTIIFMFSDHGQGIPRGKTCAIGMGYRVPFIVYFPPKWQHLNPYNQAVITDKHICFEDLAPTILQLANCTIPAEMEGKPFLGATPEWQEYIHGSRNRIDDSPGIERSVIKGKYVYTRVFSPYLPMVKNQGYDYNADILCTIRKLWAHGELLPQHQEPFLPRTTEYLYNLETDKWEINNLAYDPAYSDIVTELRTEMIRYAKQIGDIGFVPEYYMTRQAATVMPYNQRANYHTSTIIDAAMLVGEGAGVLANQLSLLTNTDPLVRYWAAVGVYNQGDVAIPHYQEIKSRLATETFEGAKIELSAFLYRYCNDAAAKDTLIAYARSKDDLLAKDAITKIQYFGDKTVEFEALINELQTYWSSNDNNYSVSPCINTTKILIQNMKNSPVGDELQSGQSYRVRNALTTGYIGVTNSSTADNASIIQTLDSTRADVVWKITATADGSVKLHNQHSNKVLSISGEATNGLKPYQTDETDASGEYWRLEPYQYGYKLVSNASERLLQVNGQSANEGATIAQWEWNGKLHFNWLLEQVSTTTALPQTTYGSMYAKMNSLYPSPATRGETIFLSYTLHQSADIVVTVTDLMGHTVLTQKEQNLLAGQYTHTISTANWGGAAQQTYVVTLHYKTNGGEQNKISQKIVVR